MKTHVFSRCDLARTKPQQGRAPKGTTLHTASAAVQLAMAAVRPASDSTHPKQPAPFFTAVLELLLLGCRGQAHITLQTLPFHQEHFVLCCVCQ